MPDLKIKGATPLTPLDLNSILLEPEIKEEAKEAPGV